MVGADLVDNRLNHSINLRIFTIIRRADVIHTIIADQRRHILARTLILRIVDRDRVTAKVLHQTHTRDVGHTVADIDHIAERHGAVLLLDVAIDQRAVVDRLHALIDFEDKLRLVGVVHRHTGPISDTVHIV